MSSLSPWWLLPLFLLPLLYLLLRYFEGVARVDWGSHSHNAIDGFGRIYCRYFHRMAPTRIPLPESGPAIVVANHISGLDPFLLIAACERPLRFIVASEEYHRFGLQWFFRAAGCIPVDRDRNPQRAYRAALQALAEGEVVALFPHGSIHLEGAPAKPLKPGAMRMAQMAGCPIYPVYLEGMRRTGHVFSPLLLPGRVRVNTAPVIDCVGAEMSECREQVRRVIEPAKK